MASETIDVVGSEGGMGGNAIWAILLLALFGFGGGAGFGGGNNNTTNEVRFVGIENKIDALGQRLQIEANHEQNCQIEKDLMQLGTRVAVENDRDRDLLTAFKGSIDAQFAQVRGEIANVALNERLRLAEAALAEEKYKCFMTTLINKQTEAIGVMMQQQSKASLIATGTIPATEAVNLFITTPQVSVC